MITRLRCLAAALAVAGATLGGGAILAQNRAELRPPAAFEGVRDEQARSVALFTEAGKVIAHPRCVNCHPATERPLQGMDGHPHLPRVVGGEAGIGAPGLACNACHGRENVTLVGTSLRSIPGNPKWALAPLEMAWEGKSLGAICEQIKDPARNGGKSLAKLHDHNANDELVGWGWNPGAGREPVPGTQKMFGDLIKAWIDTGAHCPTP